MSQLRNLNSLEVDVLRAICGDGAVDPAGTAAKVDASTASSSDFAIGANRVLFDALMVQLRRGQKPERLELINAVMGHAPRELVIDVVANAEHEFLAPRLEVLTNAAAYRRLKEALKQINGLVALEGQPVSNIVAEALQVLHTFETPAPTLRPLDSEVVGLVDDVEDIAAGRRPASLETGIPALDQCIGGLQPTLTVIGAQAGAGKSALLARLVRNLADRDVMVGVFSLEDQSRWLARRMVAEKSALPVFVLQNKPLNKHQLQAFGTASEDVHLAAQYVLVEDRKGLTAKEIVAAARVMVTRHGVKAIFVDHLGEIRLQRTDRHDRDIGDVLRELRGIADVYRVPVVVLCHMKRESDDEPRLTDFAFSADVERTARVALAVTLHGEDRQGIHILKQTSGKKGVSLWLRFNAPAAMSTNDELGEGSQ